jgi:hypothetical protein
MLILTERWNTYRGEWERADTRHVSAVEFAGLSLRAVAADFQVAVLGANPHEPIRVEARLGNHDIVAAVETYCPCAGDCGPDHAPTLDRTLRLSDTRALEHWDALTQQELHAALDRRRAAQLKEQTMSATTYTAIRAALVRADVVFRDTPDGLITIDRPDNGGRIALGEGTGGYWDFTVYGPDDEIVTTTGGEHPELVVAALAEFLPALALDGMA